MSEQPSLGTVPLQGIRVLDAAGTLAAYATRMLSDLGADVVRLVSEWTTERTTYRPADIFLNAGKRDLTLSEHDGEQLDFLLARADILFTSGPHSSLPSCLEPKTLRERFPRLIHVHVSGYGSSAPDADRASSDLTRLAAGGLLYLAGTPEREPVYPYPEQSSIAASLHATVAALMTLLHQQESGCGDFIDVSAQEAVSHSIENAAQYLDLENTVRHRVGPGPVEAGTGLFRCSDGWVYLVTSIGGKKLRWANLVDWMEECQVVGASRLREPRWDDSSFRRTTEASSIFRRIFERFALDSTKLALYEEGQRRGISISPVSSAADLLANPQLKALEFFRTIRVRDTDVLFPGPPYTFSGARVQPRTTHAQATTESILTSWSNDV